MALGGNLMAGPEFRNRRVLKCAVIVFGIATLLIPSKGSSAQPEKGLGSIIRSGDPIGCELRSYPPDPTSDIDWSAGTSGVADIQSAFNNGRAGENSQLGLSIPMLTLPSQGTWDGMSNSEKAFWLVNRERIDRGVLPMHGVEANVESIAQYYAQYLLDNDAWGHSEDGNSPWERLDTNPAIYACHDFLNVAENLAVLVTSGTSIPLPVERSVYMWMYDDAGSSWGHRHAILWFPYNDNSGAAGMEGFIGIGRASGGPYQGPFSNPWNFAELIVMNVFDPCSSWDYETDEIFSNGFETGDTAEWSLAEP